jgi:hypothetical protein
MATLDYNTRLANLQSRKYDPGLRESAVTNKFSASDIPADVKYLYESMKPIGEKYNAKTIQAAQNVQNHLERDFNLHFQRDNRTQGSVKTNTNVRVHSDFDLLTIVKKYFYEETSSGTPYTATDPNVDIVEMRRQATEIMKKQYDIVDVSGDKCISIENQNLNRKVDIVFAFWYSTDEYKKSNSEYYRGIDLYNFRLKQRQRDYPFATMQNVNYKGDQTNDGSRKGIRLLKNLRADSDTDFKLLKSFQLTSIVHGIKDELVMYNIGGELRIAQEVSNQLKKLIDEPAYRVSLKSPNGIESPLYAAETVPELMKLKTDLDLLIEDATKDITGSYNLQRTILSY